MSAPDLVDAIETVADAAAGRPTWVLDAVTGIATLVVGTAPLNEQIYDRGNYENNLRDDGTTGSKDLAREFMKHAIAVCLTSMTVDAASGAMAKILAQVPGATAVSDYYFTVNNVVKHVCEGISVYGVGGRTYKGLAAIASQAIHIGDLLYGTEPFAAQSHTGAQPPVPREPWFLLRQDDLNVATRWYRRVAFNCIATKPNACDEWPWASTIEGGEPRTHWYSSTTSANH